MTSARYVGEELWARAYTVQCSGAWNLAFALRRLLKKLQSMEKDAGVTVSKPRITFVPPPNRGSNSLGAWVATARIISLEPRTDLSRGAG